MDSVMRKLSWWLSVVAGTALTFMMLLTVADVIGRAFGHPIMGSYEVVGYTLGMVIGFSIPYVSMNKQHIIMDMFIEKASGRKKAILLISTRLLNIALFLLLGYALFIVGHEFQTSGEVSPTIRLPFFPMAYGVGICCLVECAVFISEILTCRRPAHE